jgi:thiamine biosynthesis lipoprotein
VSCRAAALILACISILGCESATRDFRHQFFAFGTLVTIDIFETDPQSNRNAISAVEKRIREIDSNWYPWRDGELHRVNEAIAEGEAIEVSAPLAELLRRAAEIERLSGGSFNPVIGGLTELWGFHDTESLRTSPPEAADIQAWLGDVVSSADITWRGNILRSESRKLVLDLGGIAKGAILEQFAQILRDAGVGNAIIDIGGDLTVIGQVDGRSARIGVRSPRSDGVIAWLEVADGETIVTSGDYERFFEYEGERYQHVLDPRTGFPVKQTISATVLHRDPILADAAATALLVAGATGFEKTCADLGLDQALIVTASGDLRLTAPMEKRLNWPDR